VSFDIVITVCDHAAHNCPLWLGRGKVIHAGSPDPAAAVGDESEQLAVFRQVRDDLRKTVADILENAAASPT
jgi:arsenate reductase